MAEILDNAGKSNILPEELKESSIEDTQGVALGLNELIDKFIRPINAIRSCSAPATIFGRAARRTEATTGSIAKAVSQDINSASFDPNTPKESRCHAFYRALGLPVMDRDGNFYNPGFNPNITNNVRLSNINVGNSIDDNVTSMQNLREQTVRDSLSIFQKFLRPQASLWSAVLDFPKPFKNIADGKEVMGLDYQSFSVPDRRDFLRNTYQNVDGTDLSPVLIEQFVGGKHILHPFLVDPTIEETVMPMERRVCQPFLTKNETAIEKDKNLLRPGIEFILRLRLNQTPTSEEEIANQVIFTLNPDQSVAGLNRNDIIDLANALLADNVINGEQTDQLFTSKFEIIQLNKYIKTIKGLIEKLVESIEVVSSTENTIQWSPFPGELGPEDAGSIKNDGPINYRVATSQLDRRISQLQLKSDNSKRQGNVDFPSNEFIFSSFENTEKVYTEDIGSAEAERNQIFRTGTEALSTIEYITGEVSGLGLVDILAVYTALWAIDMDVLVSLLDDAAFERLSKQSLKNITKLTNDTVALQNPNVEARKANGQAIYTGLEAMQILEAQIISILAFADKELERRLGTPTTAEGGAPARG